MRKLREKKRNKGNKRSKNEYHKSSLGNFTMQREKFFFVWGNFRVIAINERETLEKPYVNLD